ncbi:L-threonylcarbamoyladenylate synthase [Fictibacillus iocasae]|uniref:Threonylcarbamoyl-AMP synthase n=1 Tax=Fictibacillus iocasae TaxID=2715437 RepID=A0ABW2NPT3_9BACL
MMTYNTMVWTVDNSEQVIEKNSQLIQASLWIKKDEVVAFPTETVYGLGGNAYSDTAIGRIYEAKGRPSDNPLIVHIAERSQLQDLVGEIPDKANKLMGAFWPGPLTIIFPKGSKVSARVTGGLDTVAVRMPDHPVALEFIKSCGVPLAAPSANLSGKPSPTSAVHVYEDLSGRIPGIVDGGQTGIGVESTVVDCSVDGQVTILRPGGVTKEQLEHVLGCAVYVDPSFTKKDTAPRSPGMKYTHYAPDAPFVLVNGSREFIQQLVKQAKSEGRRAGVLTTVENEGFYSADAVIPAGVRSRPETVAAALYDALRAFNEAKVDIIYGEVFPKHGVGDAIMNRLEKAAGGNMMVEEDK